MGGREAIWRQKVDRLRDSTSRLEEAQGQMVKSDVIENVQEWHGLTQGFDWIVKRDKEKDKEKLEKPVSGWGFIQRLDAETDGPVVICKTWRAQRCLQAQMKEHVFSKAYMCLVHGRVDNKVHYVKERFGEIGSEASTAVMLKYGADTDPFFELCESGKWRERKLRMAETFFKPLAYYKKKEDNSDYTLVYVNILSGITHQVRVTLQSVGHPLVSDDRYLPKEQAMADLKWCPRNFLTEVRSDWFDMCGPYKDEKRRRYERISMENPLPTLFQQVLERLVLIDKLDPTADLYVGTEYWALGDVELMNAFPKDEEYRRKVIRWCQRRHIHLDAIDRLLLLSKEDIDDVLNQYRGPEDRDDLCWLCPKCMNLMCPWSSFEDKCF